MFPFGRNSAVRGPASLGRGIYVRSMASAQAVVVISFESSLPSGWTLTRGSYATYQTHSSSIIGVEPNVPRFENIGDTSGSALLLEKAAINDFLQTDAFTTSPWTPQAVLFSESNSQLSPSGTMTADSIQFSSSAGSRVEQSYGTPHPNSVIVASFWALRSGTFGGDAFRVLVENMAGGNSTKAYSFTGSTWGRFDNFVLTLTGAQTARLSDFRNGLGGAAHTGAFYLAHSQLESGSYPTSYIPAVANAASRSADSLISDTTTQPFWLGREGLAISILHRLEWGVNDLTASLTGVNQEWKRYIATWGSENHGLRYYVSSSNTSSVSLQLISSGAVLAQFSGCSFPRNSWQEARFYLSQTSSVVICNGMSQSVTTVIDQYLPLYQIPTGTIRLGGIVSGSGHELDGAIKTLSSQSFQEPTVITPAAISSSALFLWNRADNMRLTGVLTGTVWNPLHPSNMTASSPGDPAGGILSASDFRLNNRPSIHFNGINDQYRIGPVTASVPFLHNGSGSAFAVILHNMSGGSAVGRTILDNCNGSNNVPGMGLVTSANTRLTLFNIGSGVAVLPTANLSMSLSSSTFIYGSYKSGANPDFLYQINDQIMSGNAVTTPSGTLNPNHLVLGARAAGTTFMQGNFAELIIYSASLSEVDRLALYRYAANRYPSVWSPWLVDNEHTGAWYAERFTGVSNGASFVHNKWSNQLLNLSQSTAAARPGITGSDVGMNFWTSYNFDGVDDGLAAGAPSTSGSWKYIHDGTGMCLFGALVVSASTVGGVGGAMVLLDNRNNSSANTGITLTTTGSTFALTVAVSNGAGNLFNVATANGTFPTGSLNTFCIVYKENASPNEYEVWVNNVLRASGVTALTPDPGDPLARILLSRTQGGAGFAGVRFSELGSIKSIAYKEQVLAYLKNKYLVG